VASREALFREPCASSTALDTATLSRRFAQPKSALALTNSAYRSLLDQPEEPLACMCDRNEPLKQFLLHS